MAKKIEENPELVQEKQENAETIEVVVTARFRDKNDHSTWYEIGTEIEFEKERAENLIERGLAELKIEG